VPSCPELFDHKVLRVPGYDHRNAGGDAMEPRQPLRQQRAPGASYDVFEPSSGIEEIYVDGFDTITAGPAVVKIALYTVHGLRHEEGETVEQRTLRLQLAMPATALYDLVSNVARLLAENSDEMRQSLERQASKVREFLDVAAKLGISRDG
ncbi:MAG: hypothetical protein ACREER_04995, partial [Alphaproteobacteria bacterium]